ncbi:methyl-accepting chemotaxis sensory transducer [Rippkaea orientalis PCC 8801]|uniref:Methyl-accepting chemotaxis sensory transducer n=1 Tax=Rippkaea orientalis (strain PCC 8801 / RF-1) TaxID=41431 RepID=B7JV77_RIPO1|nr:HAMP domain-containing methyl-accepting chemotaxis protein [Rippkaea orientalis]ACK68210.1 methyl-accepting chemotaxis sensory transducer [Rippkaea orientalis PCC 8801]
MLDFLPSSSSESRNSKPMNSSDETKDNEALQKILCATTLEKSGDLVGAIALYQEVIETDEQGTYRAIAQQALAVLNIQDNSEKKTSDLLIEPRPEISAQPLPFLPWHQQLLKQFYDLPIQTKQFAVLLTSEVVAILGLVGVGATLIITNGQAQLLNQAKAELKVAELNYNIKIDQMQLGFRSQADNTAIIAAAETSQANGTVLGILANEIAKNKIEIAILVNAQGKTVATGNIKVVPRPFDPHGLVTQALKSGKHSQISELITYDELAKENSLIAQLRADDMGVSPASKPNFLIRYTITPIRNGKAAIVGALISGDIVKLPIVKDTVEAFNSGYSAIYLHDPTTGKFTLATSQKQVENGKIKKNVPLSNTNILKQAIAAKGETVTGIGQIGYRSSMMAAKTLFNASGAPIAVLVRGTSHRALDTLISQSLALQGISAVVVLVISVALVRLLGRAILKPLEQLMKVTNEFSAGNREVRAQKFANDEMGELATNFNYMADSIVAKEQKLAQYAEQQAAEAEKQRQAKENLQQEVIEMLLDIEEVQKGDLTVKAQVNEGVVGSVADAFNTTTSALRQLVLQVQQVSNRVSELALQEQTSISNLSEGAISQAEEINQVLQGVAEINTSIQSVALSTDEAAKIAHQALKQAQEGDKAMVQTVNSIQKIRSSVGGTAKKLKQLAESSQEISQIVTIISSISQKTNLLAFNASIEASRAGEHGKGFRVVAEEVGRLAIKVTDATKDIQELVETIQEDTAKVLQEMENSTSEVVTGTQLVRQTQEILQGLADTSQEIDQYLQEITVNTTAQTHASDQINQKIAGVATISQETSSEATLMVQSLQTLVEQVKALQISVSQFRL